MVPAQRLSTYNLTKADFSLCRRRGHTAVYFQLPRVLCLISTDLQHPANLAETLMVSVNGEAVASTYVGLKVQGTAKNISPVTLRRSKKSI